MPHEKESKTVTRLLPLLLSPLSAALLLTPLAFAKPAVDFELTILCVVKDICDGPVAEAERALKAIDPESAARLSPQGQTLIQFTLAGIHKDTPADQRARAYIVVEQLQGAGADINAIGALGFTALHDAVLFDDPGLVEFLLRRGALVTAKAGNGKAAGQNALEYARTLQAKKPRETRKTIIKKLEAAQGEKGR